MTSVSPEPSVHERMVELPVSLLAAILKQFGGSLAVDTQEVSLIPETASVTVWRQIDPYMFVLEYKEHP